MASRKRPRTTNNNKYPANKKWHGDFQFPPDVLSDLGVDLLSDDEEENEIYNDHDKVVAEEYKERKILKPVSVKNMTYRRSSEETVTGKNAFDLLPDEIVIGIFKYLNQKSFVELSQTCRRFRLICREESFWPRLDLASKKLDVDSIGHILTLGVKVLRLNAVMFTSPIFSSILSQKLDTFVSKVRYLDLSNAWIKLDDLAILLSKMRHLVKLSLENLTVNENVMKQITQNVDLDTLNFAMVTGLDPECLTLLTTHLPKLESLNLAWTALDSSSLSILCHKLTSNIKHLDISGAQFQLKNDDLIVLLSNCSNLESLDISDCLTVSMGTFREIIKLLPLLKYLGISRCYQIDSRALCDLKALDKLEILSAYRIIPDSLTDDICSQLPSVRVNKKPFSIIARPTVGIRRTSIWEQATRD